LTDEQNSFYRISFTLSRKNVILVTSNILCKKERGNLLAFRIQVKEDDIENPFHATSVTKNIHGAGPSLYPYLDNVGELEKPTSERDIPVKREVSPGAFSAPKEESRQKIAAGKLPSYETTTVTARGLRRSHGIPLVTGP
jgi:hypothetical protein